jgi:hypothetical protein
MLATYVPAVVTPYSIDDLIGSLRDGFEIFIGSKPRDEVLAVLTAKVRLESGNGAHAYNNDIGNIKRAAGDLGNFTCITLNEVLGGRVVWFSPEGQLAGGPGSALTGTPLPVPDGHPQTRMAALPNKVEAGRFYIAFVAGIARYAKAWQAALAGNPEAYARELGLAGYYTAPIEQYTKTTVALFSSSLARIRGLPHEDIQQPSKNDWHNQLVLDGFVEGEYQHVQDELNQGSGRAALDDEANS